MRSSTGVHPVHPAVALAASLIFAFPALAAAQNTRPCRDSSGSDRPTHCEEREQQIAAVPELTVDASPNGGITVRGWNQAGISLIAKVTANADTQEAADALAGQVQVVVEGSSVRSAGPAQRNHENWSVSFTLQVPTQTSLRLRTVNGGLMIQDIKGQMDLNTTNGGIHLLRVAGRVQGRTMNGGVSVELDGSGWQGDGLDVETTNGGVKLSLPDGYSAHLETETRNGGLHVDFPVTVQGEVGRRLSTDLGSGGPTLRLTTINGGVSVLKK
jgi:DUF4097 and DUF4098 domain-containing protein YvlB